MSTFTIARLTFYEASRRKILLAALLLGVLFLIIYGLGFHYLMLDVEDSIGIRDRVQLNEIRNFLLMAGMFVVNFLTSVMAVLTSVDTVSGEINSGTIQTLAAKPIRRWELISGKWLGFAVMLTLYLLLMAGGVMAIVYLRTGYSAPHPFRGLGLLWLNVLLLLSVSIFGGTFLSTLANGVLVFGLYGIAFIGGWIEQIGSYMGEVSAGQVAIKIGIITSLIMPSEAIWRRTVFELQSPLVKALGFSPFSALYYPSTYMVLYAVLFLLAAFAMAVWVFSQRDL